MPRPLNFLSVLVGPLLLGGCATECFEWHCPLDEQSIPKYELFLDSQDIKSLNFGQSEYRYRLIQWIGERRFAEAKDGNTKADYDQFIAYYKTVEKEAGATLAVYAEIAEARSSGRTTVADEPRPIFSKDDFIPKILPILDAPMDAQSTIAANPIITDDAAPPLDSPSVAVPTFQPPGDSLLNRSITAFIQDNQQNSSSEKDLKALIGVSAEQGDYGTAFEGLMNFAKRDIAHAQYLVGRMYQDGVGIDQDYQTAIGWLEKASNQNWDEANGALLELYEVGLGIPTNTAGLLTWHLRAAKLGNPAAQTQVGVIYENGEGTKKNMNEAAKWYQRAARQGDANGQFLLGWMYAEGQGVELDYIEAYSWFSLANSQGLTEANRLMEMVLGEMSAEQIKSARRRADQKASQLRG